MELDKEPVREGYTFTGWYADKALTEPIDDIRMTSNKTVYAGWERTGVPDRLNGDEHFAYIIGRDDGLVHPEAPITRAEVATIFFRLLTDEARDARFHFRLALGHDGRGGGYCDRSAGHRSAGSVVSAAHEDHPS